MATSLPRSRRLRSQHGLDRAHAPESALEAWWKVRGLQVYAERVRDELHAEDQALRTNAELRPEVIEKRRADVVLRARPAIEEIVETTVKAIREFAAAVDLAVERHVRADPLEVPPLHWDSVGPNERTTAPLLRRLLERDGMVLRELKLARLDRRIDAALAADKGDGTSIGELYTALLEEGDDVALGIFERDGMARLAREASDPQRQVLQAIIDESAEQRAESRLTDELKIALDHRDALLGLDQLFDALLADAAQPEFVAEQRSPALQGFAVALPSDGGGG